MAANRLHIDGLDELRETLRALPPELVAEAQVITQTHATAAAAEIAAAYPVRTGNLQRGLRVESSADRASASARVRSTARHAFIFERGTAARRWANGKSTGRMPEGRVFIPIAMARRRAMIAALVELVTRAGLKVTAA